LSKFKKECGYPWLLAQEMKLGGSQIKGGKFKCELHVEEEAFHIRRRQHHDKKQKAFVLGAYGTGLGLHIQKLNLGDGCEIARTQNHICTLRIDLR
jgi:hypothetical protein